MNLPALLLGLVLVQAEPAADAEGPADAHADQVESLEVTLVSKPGEPDLLDVVAHAAPAHEILTRLAQTTRRTFKLDGAESAIRAGQALDVNLRRRPLREAAEWVAGAAGLLVDVTRGELRCSRDARETIRSDEALRRAIRGFELALLHDPHHPDAPRMRFDIANAHYQLGAWDQAILAYETLEKTSPEFGDVAYAYLRSGHAHAHKQDENGAQAQWQTLAELFPRHVLVASARLEWVRSLRRQKDDANANLVLRLVVEGMRDGLAPEDLVTAGELLDEGGESVRAIEALQWALQATDDLRLEERALAGLARAQMRRADWPSVIATADRYLRKFPDGAEAAVICERLAQAARGLDDPFTALLAIRRARELKPAEDVLPRLDLLEGQALAAAGLAERAVACLSRAGAADAPEVAAAALELHARLLRDGGEFEHAGQLYEKLAALPGHGDAAAIGVAEVSLLQRGFTRCLAVIEKALRTADPATRQRLLEIADAALHGAKAAGGGALSIDALIAPPDASEAPVDPEPAQEESDGR